MTSRLVLMCGPAGSGKSTFARRLEDAGHVLLSIDELAWASGITQDHPLPDGVAARLDADLRAQLEQLLRDGRDVVVDNSFWSRAARDEYRAIGAAHGVIAETVFVRVPREVALARVAARGGTGPGDVRLTPEVAAAYYDGLETPTPDEGPLRIVDGA
ncbi:putative kinase [Promicromonospora sp. AC04]|uniref:AAA family ATPase n=1 Tax=Promicromonospora sp. AC04 TaxID=2135723 RepID=UPI000D4BB9D3|nr:ATP-binding protein [Promicromonospora sp. AC04]PUB24030.1 putative kinase [Promicromonospora sp. AC04]